MKLGKFLFVPLMIFLFFAAAGEATASDFDWTEDFNLRAESDPSGFRVRLATRFRVGGTQIDAILSQVEKPGDAYMVLRLCEMSSRSTDFVIEKYRAEKGRGWGVLAKSLGVKPGSSEFHALKRGHDIPEPKAKEKDAEKGKSKSKK